MRTSRTVGTVLRYVAASGAFVAFLGVCATLGAIVSETPEGVPVGWAVTIVGGAASGAAIIVLLGRRYLVSRR